MRRNALTDGEIVCGNPSQSSVSVACLRVALHKLLNGRILLSFFLRGSHALLLCFHLSGDSLMHPLYITPSIISTFRFQALMLLVSQTESASHS